MVARESDLRPANVTTDTVSVVPNTYGVLTSIWTMATFVIQFTVIIINDFFHNLLSLSGSENVGREQKPEASQKAGSKKSKLSS